MSVRWSFRLASVFLLLLVAALAGVAALGREQRAVAVISTPIAPPEAQRPVSDTSHPPTPPVAPPPVFASPQPSVAPDDLTCPVRCLVRVAANTATATRWRSASTAYAFADPATLARLRGDGASYIVVQPDDATDALYVLAGVRPNQDALVRQFGTVRDTVGDVRLLASTKLPLHIAELTVAGIRVEKLPPACAAPPRGPQPFALAETLREITVIGTREATPLGDRQYDGPGTVFAAEYLFCRFAALGYTTRYHSFPDIEGHQQQNVVAFPPGKEQGDELALVVGHYDTVSPKNQSAPGADDNGSGLAAMLDLASRQQAGGFAQRMGFVAFAAEEPGLLGSKAYTTMLAAAGTKLRAVINLDAIGLPADGRIYINGNLASRPLYQQLVGASTDAYTLLWMANPNFLSDDEYFRRRGYVAVMISTHPFNTSPIHHTERDRVENLDLKQIGDITDLVWKWLAVT